jgi:predicted nucleotidyltransferase
MLTIHILGSAIHLSDIKVVIVSDEVGGGERHRPLKRVFKSLKSRLKIPSIARTPVRFRNLSNIYENSINLEEDENYLDNASHLMPMKIQHLYKEYYR